MSCVGTGSTIGLRRTKVHIPPAVRFKAKPPIALVQSARLCWLGISSGVVLMDASDGSNSARRQDITGLELSYVAAAMSTAKVRPVRKHDRKPQRLSVEALAALVFPPCRSPLEDKCPKH
jgi:SRSO17 transposase